MYEVPENNFKKENSLISNIVQKTPQKERLESNNLSDSVKNIFRKIFLGFPLFKITKMIENVLAKPVEKKAIYWFQSKSDCSDR